MQNITLLKHTKPITYMKNIILYQKEVSPQMLVKKDNLRKVMKLAWKLFRENEMSFKDALKKSWKKYKSPKEVAERKKQQLILF